MGQSLLQNGANLLESGEGIKKWAVHLRGTRKNGGPCLLIGTIQFESGVV